MNFEKGQDPKEALGIGVETMMKELDVIKVYREDFIRGGDMDIKDMKSDTYTKYRKCGIMIAIDKGKFQIIKNRYGNVNGDSYYEEKDLPKIIRTLYELAKDWNNDLDDFNFPKMHIYSARTVAGDLVPVFPLSAPQGILPTADTYYTRQPKNGKRNTNIRKRQRPRKSPRSR